MSAAPGFQVMYASDSDQFWTVQTHRPEQGMFFKPVEVVPIALVGVGRWSVDASDPFVPRAIHASGRRLPLNHAIREGKVRVRAQGFALAS